MLEFINIKYLYKLESFINYLNETSNELYNCFINDYPFNREKVIFINKIINLALQKGKKPMLLTKYCSQIDKIMKKFFKLSRKNKDKGDKYLNKSINKLNKNFINDEIIEELNIYILNYSFILYNIIESVNPYLNKKVLVYTEKFKDEYFLRFFYKNINVLKEIYSSFDFDSLFNEFINFLIEENKSKDGNTFLIEIIVKDIIKDEDSIYFKEFYNKDIYENLLKLVFNITL